MDDFCHTFDLSTWQVCFYSPEGTWAQEEAPLSVDIPVQKCPPEICCSHTPGLLSVFTVASVTVCSRLAALNEVLCNSYYQGEGPILLHVPVSSLCFASLLGTCLTMLISSFSFFKSLMRLVSESCVNLSLYSLF